MEEIFELIRKERERQVVAKGYTFEQDDVRRANGTLGDVAAHYAVSNRDLMDMRPSDWDDTLISQHRRNPDDRIGDLVKAAALIVAEIQRIKRVEHKGAGEIPMTADQFKHFMNMWDKDMREHDKEQIKEVANQIADAVIKKCKLWAADQSRHVGDADEAYRRTVAKAIELEDYPGILQGIDEAVKEGKFELRVVPAPDYVIARHLTDNGYVVRLGNKDGYLKVGDGESDYEENLEKSTYLQISWEQLI